MSRLIVQGTLVCALAVAVAVGAPAASLATGAADDNDAGRLNLNADVLVNESVGAGTAGDFAIRGRLFSEEVSTRAREQREARADRLNVASTLTFESAAVVEEYQTVRNGLFDGYSSEARAEAQEVREDSPILFVVVLVVGVPVVVIGGVSLGRGWARRRRVSA